MDQPAEPARRGATRLVAFVPGGRGYAVIPITANSLDWSPTKRRVAQPAAFLHGGEDTVFLPALEPSDSPLLDADARATFTETLHGNFCVSAGAGVGKTTAIVRRIANLALRRREGVGNLLSRLVVVTYGKLAAEELRMRTRDLVLQHLHQGAPGRQTLLADLRSAFFGTIHSFCLKLIRDEGRFLGLPENVTLLEERDTGRLWERFCESDELLRLELPPLLLERVSRHLTFDEVLELARQFGPEDTEVRRDFDPESEPPAPDFSAALDDDGGRAKPATRANQEHLRRWQEEFANGGTFLQMPEYSRGSSSFLTAVEEALKPHAAWLDAAAGHLAVQIARAFTRYRLEKGLMTFQDQVYWCGRLVADPMVLNRLRLREYIIILDEAQDTDAAMFSILTEITRPIGAVAGSWPLEADAPPPERGRFCFVGDDQQAIYGERADLAVYRRYIDAYKEGNGGEYLEFSVTMRCPQRVIRAVNGVFGRGRLDQALVKFRPLDPRPNCPEGAAWRLELGEISKGEGRVGVDARLKRECEQIADFVKAKGLEGLGVERWSEVAVICPRVRWLENAAAVFETRELPTCLLSQRRAARELARYSWPAALLHVLVHPWDRFELIGVLREMFAVSDVDMARLHRRAGVAGEGNGLVFWPEAPAVIKANTASLRLHKALGLLHALRARMPGEAGAGEAGATLSRYVDFVLKETAMAARLEAIGESSEALAALRARALQAECEGMTLRAWVAALVAGLDEPVPPQPGAQDAVQFLTCLKAKGLEWPVVIPLGMGCEIRERSRTYPRLERGSGRTEILLSKVSVDPDRRIAHAKSCADEFQRMLYVTLTRAKRLLIAPDGRALYDGREPNFLGLARWDELDLPSLFVPPPDAAVEDSREKVRQPGSRHQPLPFRANKRRLTQAAEISRQIPRRILPSGLVHTKEATPAGDTSPEGEDDRLSAVEDAALIGVENDQPLAGIGGIDYGNWWHAVLQRYPWKTAEPGARERYRDDQRALIVDAAGWAERAGQELSRLAESALHAEILTRGKVFLPEMPFSYPRNTEEWIEGIMDLVIVTREQELWIVDWKTDRPWQGDMSKEIFLDRLARKYGPQLRAYAEVFGRGFGKQVSRLLLYSTALGETVAVGRESQAASE